MKTHKENYDLARVIVMSGGNRFHKHLKIIFFCRVVSPHTNYGW